MCSPLVGLMTRPEVSFFTSSLGFASSLGLGLSLDSLSALAAAFSSDPDGSCAAAGMEVRTNAKQTDRRITNQPGTWHRCTSRFTAPSLTRTCRNGRAVGLIGILAPEIYKTRTIATCSQETLSILCQQLVSTARHSRQHLRPAASSLLMNCQSRKVAVKLAGEHCRRGTS